MPFAPVNPIAEPTYTSMRFDGTVEQVIEILSVINPSLANLRVDRVTAHGFKEGDNPPQWRIVLHAPNTAEDMTADPGAWVVVVSTEKIRVLTDAEYRAEFSVTQGA